MKLLPGERSRVRFPPPQCVTCQRFVAVRDPRTRRIEEPGDYGTVLSCEFECQRCVAKRAKERRDAA